MLDEQSLLQAAEQDYMNAEQLAFFDDLLLRTKQETQAEIERLRQDMDMSSHVSDVSDRATLEEEAQIAIRIADRKPRLIPKIDAARRRIQTGEYGYCLETGEPIGIARLLIRPTAEYCTDVKQLNEKRELNYEHKQR